MSFCVFISSPLSLPSSFPLCRSDGWLGPPIQQVWERVKQLHWRSSTGSVLSCSSLLAWSDAHFSHKPQTTRQTQQSTVVQNDPVQTKITILLLSNNDKPDFFCLLIRDEDAELRVDRMLLLVLKLPAKFFRLLKFHYCCLFFNIVVSYQSLHFVHTVLIYEIHSDDCTADVFWQMNKNHFF